MIREMMMARGGIEEWIDGAYHQADGGGVKARGWFSTESDDDAHVLKRGRFIIVPRHPGENNNWGPQPLPCIIKSAEFS